MSANHFTIDTFIAKVNKSLDKQLTAITERIIDLKIELTAVTVHYQHINGDVIMDKLEQKLEPIVIDDDEDDNDDIKKIINKPDYTATPNWILHELYDDNVELYNAFIDMSSGLVAKNTKNINDITINSSAVVIGCWSNYNQEVVDRIPLKAFAYCVKHKLLIQ